MPGVCFRACSSTSTPKTTATPAFDKIDGKLSSDARRCSGDDSGLVSEFLTDRLI